MTARASNVPALTYTTSDATHCTIMGPDGETTYIVIVVEDEGYALVRPDGTDAWTQICVGDLGLDDSNDFDDVVAGVLDAALGPTGSGR